MRRLTALLPYLRRYRFKVAVGLLFLLASNGLALVAPSILKEGIDVIGEGGAPGELAAWAGLLVAMAALAGAFRFLLRRLLIGVSRYAEYDLLNNLYAHLATLDAAYFRRTRTGDLMNRLTNDLAAVRLVLGPGIMNLLNTSVLLVASVILMFKLDARLALAALAPMPVLSLVVRRLGRSLHRRYTAQQESLSSLTSLAQDNLSGIRVVKAYAQEPREEERFESEATDVVTKAIATSRVQAAFHPMMSLIAGFSFVLVLGYGGASVATGRLTLGTFVAFQGYLAMLVWPMIALGWVANLLERGAASMKRLGDILDARPDIRDPREPERPAEVRGRLVFRNVGLVAEGRSVLEDIDLEIPAGTTLGVVGETGSGKTALGSLVPRLLDPTEGEVTLDGVPLRRWRLAELRRAVGYVPQEPALFSDTIRANVLFAPETGGDEEALARAASKAQLDHDVEGFPQGYDTEIGERGVQLSGGQRSRLALARALVTEPPVLVLDDALANVDAETEARILEDLDDVLRSRTSLIISHRVSAVREAEQIVVLRDGRIVERGTHDELLRGGGFYAELHRRQTIEEEIGEMA